MDAEITARLIYYGMIIIGYGAVIFMIYYIINEYLYKKKGIEIHELIWRK